MALSVTSNFAISAGYASNNMRGSQSLMGKSINRISSGLKAPNPADDAPSYVGGTKLKGDAKGYAMLSTGVQDIAARLNMMDSTLADVGNALLDLKAQRVAYNATPSTDTDAQTALNYASEQTIQALKNAMKTAQYKNGTAFSGTAIGVYLNPNVAASTLTISRTAMTFPSAVTGLASTLSSLGVATIQSAIKAVTNRRAMIGGNISALEQISNYLSDVATSADAAYQAVTEVDMAREMTAYVKNNIQSQAAQAMVAQANQGLAQVLNLLQV